MTWRWVWSRSRITAGVVSGVIWLTVACLAPAVMAGLMALAIVIVAGWRAGWMLRCRYGVRAATKDEAAAVLRTLVPIVVLRGRNQPSLWVSGQLGCDVLAADERTLVVSGQVIGQIRDGRIADLALCEIVVRALALAAFQRSRLVAVVKLFCLPWTALAAVARPASTLARGLRPLAWLFAVMAGSDLYRCGEWIPIVLLVLLVIATVTTPHFDRAWAVRCRAMADLAVRQHLPAPSVDSAPEGRVCVPKPPTSTTERGSR